MSSFPAFFQSEIFTQALGFIGIGLFLVSFQILNPRKTMLMQSPANFILGLHFLGLEAIFLAFIAFIASLRDLGFSFFPDKIKPFLLAGFLFILYAGGYFMAKELFDYYGLAGATLTAIAQFFRHRFYIYRLFSIGHQIFWLITYVLVFSISGTIFMAGILLSNIIGIVRYTEARH